MMVMRNASNGWAILVANDRELDLILKAIDAADPRFWKEYAQEYGDLRADLVDARHGEMKRADKHRMD